MTEPARPWRMRSVSKSLKLKVLMKLADFFVDGHLAQQTIDKSLGLSFVQRVSGRHGRLLEDLTPRPPSRKGKGRKKTT